MKYEHLEIDINKIFGCHNYTTNYEIPTSNIPESEDK